MQVVGPTTHQSCEWWLILIIGKCVAGAVLFCNESLATMFLPHDKSIVKLTYILTLINSCRLFFSIADRSDNIPWMTIVKRLVVLQFYTLLWSAKICSDQDIYTGWSGWRVGTTYEAQVCLWCTKPMFYVSYWDMLVWCCSITIRSQQSKVHVFG